ncbi:hypothetical protein HJG43_09055 [Kineosporiaceae bacterium SCSIO 59966]|nr:hypothetical protein HJG43_09055 [Kineosporiaceae bacterium SCSIO 59966]
MTGGDRRYGVRWRRATVMNLVGLLLLSWIATLLSSGTTRGLGGPDLVLQGKKSHFSTAKLSTTDVGFGLVPIQVETGTGTQTRYVLRMGFAAGSLDGFCLSQTEQFLGTDWTIRVTSRDGQLNVADVSGSKVQFDVTSVTSTDAPNTSGNGISLRGNVAFGAATQDVTTWRDSAGNPVVNPLDAPADLTGINGRLFAIDSDVGELYNVTGEIYDAVIEGPIMIKNLLIDVVPGTEETAGCTAGEIIY